MKKRKNIHLFDAESMSNLKQMIQSKDKAASSMGVELLKNANLNDEETRKQITWLSQQNIMDWYEMDAETMKEVIDIFVYFEEEEYLTHETKVELGKTKEGNDVVHWMDVKVAALIEKEFVARKHLAEEWLDDKCDDERKESIEVEIHEINKRVADLLGIEYQMND